MNKSFLFLIILLLIKVSPSFAQDCKKDSLFSGNNIYKNCHTISIWLNNRVTHLEKFYVIKWDPKLSCFCITYENHNKNSTKDLILPICDTSKIEYTMQLHRFLNSDTLFYGPPTVNPFSEKFIKPYGFCAYFITSTIENPEKEYFSNQGFINCKQYEGNYNYVKIYGKENNKLVIKLIKRVRKELKQIMNSARKNNYLLIKS